MDYIKDYIPYFFIPWDFVAEKMDWLPAAEHVWWGQLLIGYCSSGFLLAILIIMKDEFKVRVLGYPRPLPTDTSSTSSTNYQQQKSDTQLYADLMNGVLEGNVAQVKTALDEGAKRDSILNKRAVFTYSGVLNLKAATKITTPLFAAVSNAKKEDDTFTEIAIMLLNAGADKIVATDNKTGEKSSILDYTAKDIAAHNKNNKLLKALAASSLPRPVSARSAEKDKKKN